MARLPGAEALGQRPTPRAPTGVVAGPGATGYENQSTGMEDATGRALVQAGGAVLNAADVFAQEQERQNLLRAEDAFNKLSEKRLDLTYGEENGFRKLRGEAAVTKPIMKEYSDRLRLASEEIASKLATPEQKALFKRRAAVAEVQFKHDLLQHVSAENESYRKQVLNTAISTAQRESAANPGTVGANIVRISALIDQEPGLTEETRNAAKLEAASGMHLSVMNELLSMNKSKEARAYFAANQKQIDPTKWDEVRKTMEHVSVKNDSLVLAMELGQKGGLNSQLNTLNQMFKEGKVSAEIVDATRTRLEHTWSLRKAQQAEGEKSLMGAAQDFLLKNPTKSVEDLPTNIYNGLKNTGHLASIVQFSKAGRFDNDPKAWLDFTSLPRSELAKMTPDELYTRYRGKFDDAHLERAGALLQAAKDPDNVKHAGIVTVNEAVKRSAQSAGIIPWTGTPNKTQAEAYSMYETEVDRRVKAFEQSTLGGKRQASAEEVKKITDGLLMDKVFVESFGFDPQKRVFQLTGEDVKNAYVKIGGFGEVKLSSIPSNQRMEIITELRARGRPVTEQVIAEYWVKAGMPK